VSLGSAPTSSSQIGYITSTTSTISSPTPVFNGEFNVFNAISLDPGVWIISANVGFCTNSSTNSTISTISIWFTNNNTEIGGRQTMTSSNNTLYIRDLPTSIIALTTLLPYKLTSTGSINIHFFIGGTLNGSLVYVSPYLSAIRVA